MIAAGVFSYDMIAAGFFSYDMIAAGFFSYDMIAAIGAHNACYSITIPQNAKVNTAIAAIDDDDWAPIAYTRGGEAQVAETTIEAGRRGDKLHGDDAKRAELRLIVRRTRLLGAQGELWPNWRHHCFVTDREDLDTCSADTYHRAHATVELAIRDLKEGSGLSRCPSGRFPANGAWLACCVLAHNLIRWTARLGRAHPTPTHRRSHHPQPAPHRARPPRQPQRPTQTAPAAQLALAEHLHHRPATNPQPTPAHLTRAPRPAQHNPTPPATNPPQPRTPVPHAPKRASPHTRTSPTATRPQTDDPTNPSVDSG